MGLLRYGAVFAGCALSACVISPSDMGANPPHPLPPHLTSSQVVIFESLTYTSGNDVSQCGQASIQTATAMDSWSPPIAIATNDNGGGCIQNFAIYDPAGELGSFRLIMQWNATSGGVTAQCSSPGHPIPAAFEIPISKTLPPKLSESIVMDMDSRAGGCVQSWVVEDSDDFEWQVIAIASGQGKRDGCRPTSDATNPFIAERGHPFAFTLDTDRDTNPCLLQYRLLKKADRAMLREKKMLPQ